MIQWKSRKYRVTSKISLSQSIKGSSILEVLLEDHDLLGFETKSILVFLKVKICIARVNCEEHKGSRVTFNQL
jgi:hypothetical protein